MWKVLIETGKLAGWQCALIPVGILLLLLIVWAASTFRDEVED